MDFARNSLKHFVVFRTMFMPEMKQKILIFAPHEDDEIVGTGTTILKNSESDITVIFVTKGILCNDQIRNKLSFREKEAQEIAKLLDVGLIFLNFYMYELNNVERVKTAVNKVKEIIKKLKPDKIYVTAYEGGNFDHDITNLIVCRAAKNYKCTIYEYFEYAPRFYLSDVLHKIIQKIFIKKYATDDNVLKKIELLKKYKSQEPEKLVKKFGRPDIIIKKRNLDYSKPPYNLRYSENIAKLVAYLLKFFGKNGNKWFKEHTIYRGKENFKTFQKINEELTFNYNENEINMASPFICNGVLVDGKK